MKCPTCIDPVLVMSDRQGIEIDYCPLCRGVWLDRGELDKLIALGASAGRGHAVAQAPAPASSARPDFQDSDHRSGPGNPASRKKSWLSDVFD